MRGPDWQPSLDDPEIQAYILDEVGEDGLEMAAFIAEHEPIGGVDILEKHEEEKPSTVRKVLYAMMQAKVAEYEKDTDAKGWETFIWRLNLNQMKYVLQRRWQDELAHLRIQLKFEQDNEFYTCPSSHRRMVFEDAMDLQFQCPVCGEMMSPTDNSDVKQALEERINELVPVLEAQ